MGILQVIRYLKHGTLVVDKICRPFQSCYHQEIPLTTHSNITMWLLAYMIYHGNLFHNACLRLQPITVQINLAVSTSPLSFFCEELYSLLLETESSCPLFDTHEGGKREGQD